MAKKKKDEGGVPGWIVTYGDMMSLLLTFFIMLYAISSLDAAKAQAVSQSMREQFGYHPQMYVPIPGARHDKSLKDGRPQKSSTFQEGNPARPSLSTLSPKEKVNNSFVRFVSGSEELDEESRRHLDSILSELQGRPQKIELKGRTSQGEKKGPYRSDMDIAYARAYKVREYLIDKGIKNTRIELNIVGANDPVPESLDSSPTANSSVEISLLSESTR